MNQPQIPSGKWDFSRRLKSLGRQPPAETDAGLGSDPDTALAEALTWLAEATGEAAPNDPDTAWQRVLAGIAVEAERGSERAMGRWGDGAMGRWGDFPVAPSRPRALAPSFPRWWAPALAAALLVGVLGWLAGTRSVPVDRRAPRVVGVRVDATLWDTDGLAREPAEHAIDAMNRILKP